MAAPSLTLYEHTEELFELIHQHEEADNEDDQTAVASAILNAIGRTREKVDRCCHVIAELEAHAANCDAEIKRLQKRKEQSSRHVQLLKDLITDSMVNFGLKRMEGNHSKLWMQTSPGAVEILDVASIPEEYIKRIEEISTRRDAIARDLRAGKVVPGARLVHRPILRRS